MMFISEKRGVSLMVAYTLLVVIAIALSVIVSSYLTQFLPSQREQCPADINLIIEETSCITTNQQLSVTLSNRGLFTVSGMFVRFARDGRDVRPQINKGREVLPVPLEPNSDSLSFTFDVSGENVNTSENYILEIQPAILSKRVLIPCENIVTTTLECTSGNGGGNRCGDGNIADGEQCDPPGGQAQCQSGYTCNSACQCKQDTHLECASNTCTIVSGSGSDSCSPEGSQCGGAQPCNGGCGGGEYCDDNGTYSECRKITSCQDYYENTTQDGWWFFNENWRKNDNGYGNPLGVYVPTACEIFEKDEGGNDIRIASYNDTCLDRTTLQQYYCVDKNDTYGTNYQTCEVLQDFIYGDQAFNCEGNYYGPHCIINGESVSCTSDCGTYGGVYGECRPYYDDFDNSLCYYSEFPTPPTDGNYCLYDIYGEKAYCYYGDYAC